MSYKHFRDCYFRVGAFEGVFAESVSVDTSSSVSPVYLHGSKKDSGVVADGPVETQISIRYYITGADPIKEFVEDQSETISGYFAGFSFPSGYLTSYRITAEPNQPVMVDASIKVFGDLEGSQSAIGTNLDPSTLNYNFASLTQMTSDYSNETYVNADSISYNYNLELEAEYTHSTGDMGQNPYRVVYGKKTLEMSVSSDETKMTLPITGDRGGLILNLKNSSNQTTNIFQCSGTITNRNISTSVGNELRSQYTIEQWNASNEPIVTGFALTNHTSNGVIGFGGTNLESIISARINCCYVNNLRYSNGYVTGDISPRALSGDLFVSTEWGEKKSEVHIPNWSYPNINITGLSTSEGRADESIIISGENFYNISSVEFNSSISANYRVLSPIAIETTVPDSATIGVITVTSSDRNKNDTSASFSPRPVITSLSTPEAQVGDTITLYGTNFASISDVKFNGISATTFNVISTTQMSAQVPDGNNAGSISIITSDGFTTYSPYNFWPTLIINSVTKANDTVAEGDSLALNLNQSVNSQMLYSTDGGSTFLVAFGNNTAAFTLSASTLNGAVPENAKTGPVHIYRPDGASVYSSGWWLDVTDQAPIIKDVNPKKLIKAGNTSIDFTVKGTRFKNTQKIFLMGGYTNDDGTVSTDKVELSTSDFNEDIFGKTLIANDNTKMSSIAVGAYDVVVSGEYFGAGAPLMKDTKVKGLTII